MRHLFHNLEHEDMWIAFKNFPGIIPNPFPVRLMVDTHHGGKTFQDRLSDMHPVTGLLIVQIYIFREELFGPCRSNATINEIIMTNRISQTMITAR